MVKASEACLEIGWEMTKNLRWKLEHLALLSVPLKTETILQVSPSNLRDSGICLWHHLVPSLLANNVGDKREEIKPGEILKGVCLRVDRVGSLLNTH